MIRSSPQYAVQNPAGQVVVGVPQPAKVNIPAAYLAARDYAMQWPSAMESKQQQNAFFAAYREAPLPAFYGSR